MAARNAALKGVQYHDILKGSLFHGTVKMYVRSPFDVLLSSGCLTLSRGLRPRSMHCSWQALAPLVKARGFEMTPYGIRGKCNDSKGSYYPLRVRHLLRFDQLIEFLACKVPQLQRRLAQAGMIDVGGMGDLRCFVVSDLGR